MLEALAEEGAVLPIKTNAIGLVPLMRYAVKPAQGTIPVKGMTPWPVMINGDEPFTIEEWDQRGVTFLEAAAQYVKRERENSLQDGGATSAP